MRGYGICRKWRGVLAACVDGTASFEQRRAFERHMQRCPACREQYESLLAVRRGVRLLERKRAPALLADGVRAALQGQRGAAAPFAWLGTAWGGWLVRGLSLAALAALLLIAWELRAPSRLLAPGQLAQPSPALVATDEEADVELIHEAWYMQEIADDSPLADHAVVDFAYAASWQDLVPPRLRRATASPKKTVRVQ